MTITPDQARELLDGATPGPWKKRRDRDGNPTPVVVSAGPTERHHIMTAEPASSTDRQQGDTALIAAAPDLAQTVIDQAKRIEELEAQLAGMTWQTGVHAGDEYIWAETPEEEAIAVVAAKRPEVRLVRRSVSAPEVIDDE